MADNVTATGKYFLISVPEFADDPVGPRQGEKMSSFIRLGAFHESPETADDATKRALELAKLAQVVSSGQGGHLTAPYGAEVDTSVTGVEGKGVFLDDQRNDDPEQLSPEKRLEQSAALLTRGGWWDHSDGNRITTTYGDKVEVIRGNYKMVVMHRQDDPEGGGGWDLSGGHVQDLGPNSMPGASVRVEFRPGMFGQPGTWHLENTTNNFIQTSDYAGDFFEHWFGNLKESTIGSEHPEEWNKEKEKPYGNPHIKEKVWAKKIERYTGSDSWRIPEIAEKLYAETTSSTIDVSGDIHQTTYCDGTITSKTGSASRGVPEIKEETWADTTVAVTNVGAAVETTNLGTQVSTTIAGAVADVAVVGAMEEVAVHGHHGLLELAAIYNEFFLGLARTTVNVAAGMYDVNIGFKDGFDYPNKKKVALKNLKVALDDLDVFVNSNKFGPQLKISCMSQVLQAMHVAIGL